MKIEKIHEMDAIPAFTYKIEYSEYRGASKEPLLTRNLKDETVFYVIKEAHSPVLIDSTLFKTEAGETLIVPPFRIITLINTNESFRFYRLTVPTALLNRHYPLLLAACANRRNKLTTGAEKETLFTLCERLLTDKENSLFRFLSLLELLNKHISPYTENDEEIESYEFCLPLSIKKSMLYMKNHFKSHLTQEQIAKENGLSGAILHKLFREHLGLSPKDYLKLIKMQNASELLFCFDSIDATAHALAYSTTARFSADFKESFGTSPSSYLKSGGIVCGLLV